MKKALSIIAIAFSGFFVYLFDKIWGNSIAWENIKSVRIREFLTNKVELYQILIFLIFTILLYFFGKLLINNKKSHYSKKQIKLREFNKSIIKNEDILLRWKVYFDYDTPYIADLTPFCKKHEGPPIRFINNSCPNEDCEYSQINFDEVSTKNAIESDLIDRWDKMN